MMKIIIDKLARLRYKDLFIVLGVISLYLIFQRRIWITHELMVSHDSFRWYGIFAYLADSLVNGFFPYWNPFMNCGEPFFLNINILRLEDPTTFLLILIGKTAKINFLTLYHYDLLVRYLIFVSGCYFFFRLVAKYRISAFIAFIVITFSSFGASYLRQHNLLLNVYLLPWVLLFMFRFLEEKKAIYLLGLAFFSGILFPSYISMFSIWFIAVLLIALLLTKGVKLPKMRYFISEYRVTLLAAAILLLLSLRLLPIALRYNSIVPVVRMFEVTYEAYSKPFDFFILFAPYYFKFYFGALHSILSESFLYIGLLPLLFLLIGLFFSNHRYKFGFLITGVFTALVMMGDKAFMFPLMKKVFPFFYMIRNMQGFGPFFLFCLSYFVCVGLDTTFERVYSRDKKKIRTFFTPAFIICAVIIILAALFSISVFYGGIQFADTPTTLEEFKVFARDSRAQSTINIIFFAMAAVSIFFLLIRSRNNITKRLGVTLLAVFILADLCFANRAMLNFTVKPRPEGDRNLPPFATKTTYSDLRARKPNMAWPFLPVIFKQFTAYHDVNMYGTHFFETAEYFKFSTSTVPDSVKDSWAGITGSKLRFVPKCISGHDDYIIKISQDMDPEVSKRVVFIEEDLPQKYAHLTASPENLNIDNFQPCNGKLDGFTPNELNLDIEAGQDSLLYYSDGYDVDWRVFIDGIEKKVYKANLAFKAVVIPEGRHRASFIYDPRFYRFALYAYFFGLFLSLIVLIRFAIAKNRKGDISS